VIPIDWLVRLVVAVAIVTGFTIAGHLLGSLIARALGGRDPRQAGVARRLTRWIAASLGVVIGLQTLGLTAVATSLLATGGVAAVVLGFAFREIGENLLAGIFLSFSRAFDVGDLIESGGLRGEVKGISLRDTHIRTAGGCDVFIPSSHIYSNPLLNFTRDGLRRGSFRIGVDYGDDPIEARRLLRASVAGIGGVLTEPAPKVEIAELAGAWVELETFLWVDTDAGTSLSDARTNAMAAARRTLLDNGFTLSSDTTTAVDLRPVSVRLNNT
jgi:small-conductance mechanosensitive channel